MTATLLILMVVQAHAQFYQAGHVLVHPLFVNFAEIVREKGPKHVMTETGWWEMDAAKLAQSNQDGCVQVP
jgi:hypothetical protein